MASLLSPRRPEAEIALRATIPQEERTTPSIDEPDAPFIGWPIAAVGGALAAALAGWILVAGLTVVGWLAADPGSFLGALRVGTRLWLLANGAGARLGTTSLSLIPWGATFIFAFMVFKFATFAARQARGRPSVSATCITGAMALGYAAPVIAAALVLGQPLPTLRGLVSVTLMMSLAAAWGSCRELGYDPTQRWPGWCRAIPRAVLGAQLTMIVMGTAALTASLVVHLHRVTELTSSLQAGVAGGIALLFAQLAFAPNAIIWAASYTLGAGFSPAQGSVVAPSLTELGMLPSVPLFGAMPVPGAGGSVQLWWLAAGVLAGGVAAWLVMRARPAARFDDTSLVGGASGVLAGLVFAGLAWAAGGDLGSARLAGVGPRLLPLVIMSATTMGLAGMIVGLLLGLLRRLRR